MECCMRLVRSYHLDGVNSHSVYAHKLVVLTVNSSNYSDITSCSGPYTFPRYWESIWMPRVEKMHCKGDVVWVWYEVIIWIERIPTQCQMTGWLRMLVKNSYCSDITYCLIVAGPYTFPRYWDSIWLPRVDKMHPKGNVVWVSYDIIFGMKRIATQCLLTGWS